jgi:ubiquinone/menaquinone biosynthesis C-methylase UbiE
MEMNLSSYFSKQARKPSGIIGWFIAPMIFDKGNTELNDFVFDVLSLNKNDRLLEIGFGTGKLMNKIANHLSEGLMEGLDFSKTMVDLANKKSRKNIRQGKIKIHLGDFDAAFFQACAYDKIFTVNTIYFWRDPIHTINKIHRLLKPGGKVVIGFHAKHEMEKMPLDRNIFRYYAAHDMQKLLSTCWKIKDIRILRKKANRKTCYCAVAEK